MHCFKNVVFLLFGNNNILKSFISVVEGREDSFKYRLCYLKFIISTDNKKIRRL